MSVRIEISDLVVIPEQRALYNSIDKKYFDIKEFTTFDRNHVVRMYETRDGDCVTNLLSRRSSLANYLLFEDDENVKKLIVADIIQMNERIRIELSL